MNHFCQNCGHPLATVASVCSECRQASSSPDPSPDLTPRKPGRLFFVGSTCLFLLGGTLSALAMYQQSGAPSKRTSTPATVVKDACSLLSVDELNRGTGGKFVKGESGVNGDDETSCAYTPGPGTLYPAKLTVTFHNGKAAMQMLQGAAPKMVPGSRSGSDLGDASFFLPMDVSLYALKGDILIAIEFGLGNYSREQKKALAAKVLSRL